MRLQVFRQYWATFLWILVFCCVQGFTRYYSREMLDVGQRKYIYREYDPRGRFVELYRKRVEREFFKVKGQFIDTVTWPGLVALEFSTTWMHILVSVYDEASLEGDFSWLFYKLRFVSHVLPQSEGAFQTALLPLFVVLGKDPAGALYLLNEKITKFKNDWRVPYWTAFHAMENLQEKKMAGSLFLEASKYPGAPEYLVPLGLRLLQGDGAINVLSVRDYAIRNLDPELLEKVKRIRPEWFKTGEKR